MDRYSFLLLAMSLDEARDVLGLPAEEVSPAEIQKAFRKKVFEYHPDRGGSHEKMVEINVAKDILEGKARPTYDRSPPSEPESDLAREEPRWSPPKRTEVTFQEALSKAGLPSGVEWLFVTERQRHGSWSSDESEHSSTAAVAYGRTGSQHVFLGMHHTSRRDFYVGGNHDEDIWSCKSLEYPVKSDEGKNPAWLHGNVNKAFRAVDFDGHFNSKIVDAQGWKPNEKLPTGSSTSIKHWLVGSGSVAGDDPSVAGRKNVVEMIHDSVYHYQEKPGFFPEAPTRWNMFNGKYTGDYHRITLVINGKPFVLSASDFLEFSKTRLGGKSLLNVIYGDYAYGDGKKKTLTRLAKGKLLLQWMTENLTDLPKEARDVLSLSAQQMK